MHGGTEEVVATNLAHVPATVLTFLLSGLGATVLLFLPGYLFIATYGQGLRGPAPSDRAFVIGTVAAGVLVHLIALPWTVRLVREVIASGPGGHLAEIVAWVVVVLLAVPVVLGAAAAALSELTRPRWLHRLLSITGLSSSVRTAEAWNWVFRQHFPAYIRVRLKDGTIVLGWYGENSFASSDATNGDLYLEEEWLARHGWFHQPLATTRGVWLRGSEILSIEFFAGEEAASPQSPNSGEHS